MVRRGTPSPGFKALSKQRDESTVCTVSVGWCLDTCLQVNIITTPARCTSAGWGSIVKVPGGGLLCAALCSCYLPTPARILVLVERSFSMIIILLFTYSQRKFGKVPY